ncbi:hypothetical protein GGI12_004890 [Dipsacomyces acuminosporus]|nr:hypothetical protein GGI12_004890 [Dipsacomyces acuminosporus]
MALKDPAPNTYPHGVLGYWAILGFGFNITSIVLSFFVIFAVVLCCVRNKQFYKITSFRLSAWIAFCDIVYSSCGLCTYHNHYMSTLGEMHLRTIHWFMSASILSFAFITACIAFHLILTVLTRKPHLAKRIEPFYELVSILLGFFITHPFLYLYKRVLWLSKMQVFFIASERWKIVRDSWLTMWGWMFLCVLFVTIVSLMIYKKMVQSLYNTQQFTNYPEPMEDASSGMTITEERMKDIRSATMRIACYPLVPILTQTWVLAANMTNSQSFWLFALAYTIPATQGMLNFLVFLMNPAWDRYRKRLLQKVRRAEKERLIIHQQKSCFSHARIPSEELNRYSDRTSISNLTSTYESRHSYQAPY